MNVTQRMSSEVRVRTEWSISAVDIGVLTASMAVTIMVGACLNTYRRRALTERQILMTNLKSVADLLPAHLPASFVVAYRRSGMLQAVR